MSKKLLRASAFLGLILCSGCTGAPSALMPQSTNARMIYNLTLVIFGIAAIVFAVVEGLLIYSAIRFSRKTAPGLPKQTEGNRRLEILWTLAPAVVLAVIFGFSVNTLRNVAYQPAGYTGGPGGNSITVRVVGHQWFWEFDYPDLNVMTADEMHVPVDTIVNVNVESADVNHSFWVPQLGGKIDAIPGHVNHTWFKADQTGTYYGQCAEFCGVEHADMRLNVIVETPDQFQAWVKLQQSPIPTMAGEAADGEKTFMSSACVGCHTIDGTTARGKVGPNLTHFASRQTFAGAILDNTPENLAKWLADPQAVKPGNKMPNLHLSQDKINALVAFVESLK